MTQQFSARLSALGCALTLVLATGGSAATAAEATAATLRSWKNWYPFDRGQDYGERVTAGWITKPLSSPRRGGQNEKIGGQSVWRYPHFDNVPEDMPFEDEKSNRPNQFMPQVFGRSLLVKPHVVNYFANWWCPTDKVFNVNDPTRNCPMTDYTEIQSEMPDAAGNPSMYLATWGWGTANSFVSMHDDSACLTATDVSVLLTDPKRRSPLLWGLPQSDNGFASYDGPSVCAVKLEDYASELGRGRVFVTIQAQQPVLDIHGNRVIEAVNGYYEEMHPTIPNQAKSGASCMTAPPTYAASLPLQKFRVYETFWPTPYTACLTMTEQYSMREIKPGYRLRNGFDSWLLHQKEAAHGLDWNHKWSNTSNQFERDRCDYVGGKPQNCRRVL